MCGGMAGWKELDNFLSRKLEVSAHPGHPWKNLLNRSLYDVKPEDSLHLASAIGLALRAISNPMKDNGQQ